MTKERLRTLEEQAYSHFKDILHEIRKKYVEENTKYPVGSFIKTPTCIFQVELIKYHDMPRHNSDRPKVLDMEISIMYCGPVYIYDGQYLIKDSSKTKQICQIDTGDNLEPFINPNPF
jgi:hypothetical protein